jgi:hypothetical protein
MTTESKASKRDEIVIRGGVQNRRVSVQLFGHPSTQCSCSTAYQAHRAVLGLAERWPNRPIEIFDIHGNQHRLDYTGDAAPDTTYLVPGSELPLSD